MTYIYIVTNINGVYRTPVICIMFIPSRTRVYEGLGLRSQLGYTVSGCRNFCVFGKFNSDSIYLEKCYLRTQKVSQLHTTLSLSVYGCIRVYTGVCECIRVYTSVFECIRVYTSVYECIRVYTSIRLLCQQHHRRGMVGQQSLVLLPYYSTDVVNCGQYTHLAYNMHIYIYIHMV